LPPNEAFLAPLQTKLVSENQGYRGLHLSPRQEVATTSSPPPPRVLSRTSIRRHNAKHKYTTLTQRKLISMLHPPPEQTGLLIAIQSPTKHAPLLQSTISTLIHSPYIHAEVALALSTSSGYTIPSGRMFTAFVGRRFQSYAVSITRYLSTPPPSSRQQHTPPPQYQWKLFFVPLNSLQCTAALDWLQKETGAPYDYTDAFLSPFRSPAPAHSPPPPYYRTLFCSQAVLALLLHVGVMPPSVDPVMCSPQTLYRLLVAASPHQVHAINSVYPPPYASS
jgi:hypothetical protein